MALQEVIKQSQEQQAFNIYPFVVKATELAGEHILIQNYIDVLGEYKDKYIPVDRNYVLNSYTNEDIPNYQKIILTLQNKI